MASANMIIVVVAPRDNGGQEYAMKKIMQKIFATASVIIAVVLILILIVTAFGGIDFEEFENSLVRGLFVTLGILYLVLSAITLVMTFVNDDAVKEIVLRSEKEGTSKASVSVVRKLVKTTCSSVDGVKCGKIAIISNEYGVRLKVAVKIVDKDVVETETYLRTMLEDAFYGALGFRFHAIEIKVTALQPAYKVNQADVSEKVEAILAENAENVENVVENEESETVANDNAEIVEAETSEAVEIVETENAEAVEAVEVEEVESAEINENQPEISGEEE